MREIKFRAWLKYKKEMVDNARPDFFCKQLHYLYSNSAGGKDVLGVSIEDIELMQYTGLKDKNEKEIYEGDIVKFLNGFFEVIWCNEKASFMLKNKKYKEFLNFIYENNNEMEIVGNIYQTLE